LDVCKRCRGVWFDGEELDRVLGKDLDEIGPPAGGAVPGMSCPRCQSVSYAFLYPGTRVTIDMCARCRGIWLDGKELEQIRAALAGAKTHAAESPGAATTMRATVGRLFSRAIDAMTLAEI